MAKIFNSEKDAGFALTLKMTAAAPAIANRIFDSLADAENFIKTDATAIEGLILTVVSDETGNTETGAYYVQSVGENGTLKKLTSSESSDELEERVAVLEEKQKYDDETLHVITGDDLD